MHETQTIEIDDPGRLSVCKSVTRRHCTNTAKRIQVAYCFGWRLFGDSRNIVLNGIDISYGFDAAFTILLSPLVILFTQSRRRSV